MTGVLFPSYSPTSVILIFFKKCLFIIWNNERHSPRETDWERERETEGERDPIHWVSWLHLDHVEAQSCSSEAQGRFPLSLWQSSTVQLLPRCIVAEVDQKWKNLISEMRCQAQPNLLHHNVWLCSITLILPTLKAANTIMWQESQSF